MRKIAIGLLVFIITIMSLIPSLPLRTEAATTTMDTPGISFGGLPQAYLDGNKATKIPDAGGSPIGLPDDLVAGFVPMDARDPLNPDQTSDYSVQEIEIEITGTLPGGKTIKGTTIAVVDYKRTADNGYPMINKYNLATWIELLGGDWAFINPRLAPYKVYLKRDQSNYLELYSLSELIYLSGGGGNSPSSSGVVFQPYSDPNYNWVKYRGLAQFKQTPVPTASIGTLKPTYKLGEPVPISATATAYSAWDRRVMVNNFSVYKKGENGSGNTRYELIDSGGYGASWSKAKTYNPPEKGTYVVTLSAVDFQQRTTVPYPIVKEFIVGDCTPFNATIKISGETDQTVAAGSPSFVMPEGKNTITLVFPQTGTLKVDGITRGTGTTFANILIGSSTVVDFIPADTTYCPWTKTFTSTGGGGDQPGDTVCDYTIRVETYTGSGRSEINTVMPSDTETAIALAYDTDTIMLSSNIKGEFSLNNNPLPSATGTGVVMESFPRDGSVFTLRFASEDGKECWVKKFYVEKRPGGGYDCPTFKVEAGYNTGTIANGTTISKGLNGKLEVRAWFKQLDSGEEDQIPVFWRVTRPDGSTGTYRWETNDRGREVLQPTDLLRIPDPNLSSTDPQYIGFNQAGTYTIEYFYDSLAGNDPYKTWKEEGCEWKIYVTVSICENISIDIKDNGRATYPKKDAATGDYTLELSKNAAIHPLTFTSNVSGELTKADWVIKRKDSATPLKTASNVDTFDYTITEVGEYIVTSTVRVGNEVCVTTIYITFGANCDDLGVVARVNNSSVRTTGRGTQSDPIVVPITLGQDNRFTLSLTMDGQLLTADYDWTLYRNGVFQYRDDVTNFSYTIPNGSAVYSVRVKERIDGVECEKWIVFKAPSAENPPVDPGTRCQDIYLHLFTNDRKYLDVAPAPTHTGSVAISVADKLDRYAVSVLDTPESTGSLINMSWESGLPNQAPSDFQDTLYLRNNTPPGTYTIKAIVNEPAKPGINGCPFVLTITITAGGTTPPPPAEGGPGGPTDGGTMKIRIYDSVNRLLASTADGVWEREPARIEVIIDQSKIDSAFSTINTRINQAIKEKEAAYRAQYGGEEYEDVQVTSTPSQWNAKTNPATTWPSSFVLSVEGPGINQSYQLQPKLQTQSKPYTGAITPTLTTWKLTLLDDDYRVSAENFTISVPYQVEFQVSYSKCEKVEAEEGSEAEKTCAPGTDSGSLSGAFTILVQGDQTQFEVYEPNATGYLAHTAEWKEYHARDRYLGSKENDFYAGERILTRVQLDAKHRHPYSNQYPTILSARAWIAETGLRSTPLQSTLALQAASSTLWKGPSNQVPKLGTRELGVDTALMGDKQRGFKKGSSNAVYFQVQFAFNVSKGYAFPDKQAGEGHDQSDYRLPFMIIANAWERQGIRNHTSR